MPAEPAAPSSVQRQLVLVGAGHAHAQVLRDWVDRPVPGVALSVISPTMLAPYSGMVPGWLAGHYGFDEICIDFAALAAAAGARLVVDELISLDPDARRLLLRSGTVLPWDLLSLNVGSTLRPPAADGAQLLSLRPLGRLRAEWDALLAAQQDDSRPLCVSAVGGGAAGVESLLAVLTRLRTLQPGRPVQGRLLTRSDTLLPGLAPAAAEAMSQALAAADVSVRLGHAWSSADTADSADGRQHLVLWATGAEAHRWQSRSMLAVSVSGFFSIDAELRSLSHPHVFAVGDCAEWSVPLPKAGVFAVRMGPVLSHNLRAALAGTALRTYQPQRQTLALLACGDHTAVAARGPWALSGQMLARWLGPAAGRWLGRRLWRWKDGIDRSFLRRFNLSDRA